MFRTIALVFCLVAVTHQLNISNFSVPRAVEKDSSAELLCEHDGKEEHSIVKWFWRPAGSDSLKQIYQQVFGGEKTLIAPHIEPVFNITLLAEDKHSLVLWDVQPEHSGSFECKVEEEEKNNSIERSGSSDMVVYTIGEGPRLTLDGNEEVEVFCEAVGVSPEADVVISYDGNIFNDTAIEGPVDGLYNVSSNITLSRHNIEGAEISCTLSFSDDGIPTSDAMRVSETYYSDAWLATTTDAPDETTELQARLEAEPQKPNSVGRTTGAWTLAALVTVLRALL